jgi:hypothetical protein
MLAQFSIAIVVLTLSTWSISQKADKRIEAQQWVETQIPKAFNSQLNPIESLATATYQDYKSDAINVDFDGGLTEAAFQEKWKKEFNTNKAGIGLSFILGVQDYELVKVERARFVKKISPSSYLFLVSFSYSENAGTLAVQLIVEEHGNSFLISDVWQEN